jgi:hypothetical protein
MAREKLQLSRRAMLRGAAGAVVSLPLLEVMLDSVSPAEADVLTSPCRYLVCYVGQSLGGDRSDYDLFVPDGTGSAYTPKRALEPLMPVRDRFSVVSGLRIPAADPGGSAPPGGRSSHFHGPSKCPQLSGMRIEGSDNFDVVGPTSDQLVVEHMVGSLAPEEIPIHQSLQYQVQAAWYLSGSGAYGRELLSYERDGSGARALRGTVSPRDAWDALFRGFAPMDEPAAAGPSIDARARVSVLDLVKSRSDRLVARLGRADQICMEQHLDEIRDLERRISALPPAAMGSCAAYPDPGADPPIGGNNLSGVQGTDGWDVNTGYSDEHRRAEIFTDLLAYAFACDLTRVGSMLYTMAQSHMNVSSFTGHPWDLHELGHSGPGTEAVTDALAWHMGLFRYLIERLDERSVLDSTAVVCLFEGGHGYDPASGNDHSSHSTENMAALVAGGAGGLVRGQHIVAPSSANHPANVLITAMNAVGVPTDTLGEVSGTIDALRA